MRNYPKNRKPSSYHPEHRRNFMVYHSDWVVFKKYAAYRGKTLCKTMHEVADAILRSHPEFAETIDPSPRMNNAKVK